MKRARQVRLATGMAGAAILLLTGFFATQRVAAALAFQKALGEPLLRIRGARIYPPWMAITWATRFYHRAPSAFEPALATAAAGLPMALFGLAFVFRRRTAPSTAYGSARWADMEDIEKARLLGSKGLVLAQTHDAILAPRKDDPDAFDVLREGELLRHQGPHHVLVFAPTRSGKGVSVVLPNLYAWTQSALVYDPKGENWAKSAGYRRKFSRCLRFEPCTESTVRYNPLLEIRRGTHEVGDARNIAEMLVDPSGAKRERTHWDDTAAELLVGTILHVLYAEKEKTLERVNQFLSDPSRAVVDIMETMRDTMHLGDRPHRAVAEAATDMLEREEREQSSVMSSAKRHLTLFRDPLVCNATSQSDFRIDDLMNADHPVSLYIVVPPSDIDRTAPLVRLMLNQMTRRLTERLVKNKHQLLLLLDEFPLLGRIEFFATGISFFAGYGIRCMPIVQDLAQLENTYGRANSILSNCKVQITYAAQGPETAQKVSDMAGQATYVHKKRSWLKAKGEREYEHARQLLTAGEVRQLPSDEAMIFVGGCPPIRAKKVVAYATDVFRGHDKIPPPSSPAEQGAELPPPRPHDWLDVLAPPLPPRPKKPSRRKSTQQQEVGQDNRQGANVVALDLHHDNDVGRRAASPDLGQQGKPEPRRGPQRAEGDPTVLDHFEERS